ncbi:voltage-gated chloride channel family protein [Dysgonomonas macrotermitis]|uniref:H+/Cl-antiporter ClcA n=1 Tax=Dysgonomonas macrotermitis TaxID=1346286 RepID=A0A1M5G4P6_9BACT|nr:voltage-gated chloride channel family protein [Dysgonomonas macrotermitis]SHF98735.1 H+/Cl-antiporter ClcA [Dysgonomonas macrotermitis]
MLLLGSHYPIQPNIIMLHPYISKFIKKVEQLPIFLYLLQWSLFSIIIGLLAGSASALLLVSLDWATNYRESHLWIIGLLPLAGLLIGLMYYYWGDRAVKGNNLLIEEVHSPDKIIPLRMAPLVLIGTFLTHLFGGSAGREGTAVQMGGAIADQFSKFFGLRKRDRKIIIIMGVSAGFASVFGTPLAGAVFALEVLIVGRMRYEAILPSFLVAIIANYTCHDLWKVSHTHYSVPFVPEMTLITLLYAVIAGIIFGLAALLFSKSVHFWSNLSKKAINYPPLRPFIGGAIIALVVWFIGSTKYIGLGVPVIVESFTVQQQWYDFLLKILITTFTLGVGFKGGEVTPLFFVGATLGSALFLIIPLPMALLAGMGFVAVFSGATNTPIACSLMGIELFGAECGVFVAIACIVAYLFSGHTGIYTSQIIGSPKHLLFGLSKGKTLSDISDATKERSAK